MKDTIFVAIASFLDYEIKYTIMDCIQKAKRPENLVFGVCLQHDDKEGTNSECLDYLAGRFNIRILKYPYLESKGGCWARHITQGLYNGEKYSLQVDSHTRFIHNWDQIIIDDYNDLKKTVNKPLLSFLPPPYMRDDRLGIDHSFKHKDHLDRMNIPTPKSMAPEYWLTYIGYGDEINTKFENKNIVLLYGGFVFTDGQWVVDVRQDPKHYYTGEEFALSIRSYTKGYDIYTPKQIIAWHRSHSSEFPSFKHFRMEEFDANEFHRRAMVRLKRLVEGGDLGKFGAGHVRTIQDYEKFAGLNFKKKEIDSERYKNP